MDGELYHFSEEPGIPRFEPRPAIAERPPGQEWLNEPLVWAIDAWHAPMYYFPRDCPRILMWPLPTTTENDRSLWWGNRDAHMVAHVDWDWFDRLSSTTLYRYTFDARPFTPLRDAGMCVSRETVEPLHVDPVPRLLDALRDARVELRFMPSLLPLRNAWDSTMHVSGIRLRNAAGWP